LYILILFIPFGVTSTISDILNPQLTKK